MEGVYSSYYVLYSTYIDEKEEKVEKQQPKRTIANSLTALVDKKFVFGFLDEYKLRGFRMLCRSGWK